MCIYQSKDFDEFQEHCKTHIGHEKAFNCHHCSYTSSSQSDLAKHSLSCAKKPSNNNVKNDRRESNNEYDCRDCNFFCNSSEQFEKHMSARHSVVWDYSCFHCTYRVQSYTLFSNHISRYHPEVLAPDPSDVDENFSAVKPQDEPCLIDCIYCSFSSESQIDVHEHMKRNHPGGAKAHNPNKRPKLEPAAKDESPFEDKLEFKPPVRSRKKKFICSDCPYKTTSNAVFLRHRKSHNNSLSYHCNICEHKTASVVMIKKHMKNSHPASSPSEWKVLKNGIESKENQFLPTMDYKCDQCSYQCSNHLALRNHKKVHVPKSLKCDHCDFQTRNWYFMNKHVSHHHPEVKQDGQTKPAKPVIPGPKSEKKTSGSLTFKFFKCDRCGFIARHQKNLEKHINSHDAEFNYKCPHCLFINTCFKTFRMHMNKFHPKEKITMKRNPLEKYKHQCEKCGYETNSQEKLRKHKIDHEEGRFYHCEICNYIAVSHVKLGKHMKLKHPQTLLKKCTQCDYSTNRSKIFKAHVLAHKDPNALKCSLCSFISSSQRQFATHMSSKHPEEQSSFETESSPSKEVPEKSPAAAVRQLWKCDMCLYSSNREAVLEVHKRCHGNPNCLKCDHCYFLTLHKYSLEKHLSEKHSIKKVYSCQKCNFTTKRVEFFRNHTKAHDSKYSYGCPSSDCHYLTIKYSSYVCHMRKEHPDEELLPERKPGESDEDDDDNDDDEDAEDENENKTGDGSDKDSDDKEDNGFACELCSFTTIYPKSMETHARAHQSSKAIKCELCDYITLSSSCYKSHVKTNHPESKLLKHQLHKCSKCEYSTGSSASFKSHQRAHGSENQYKCKHCPYLTVFYHSICSHMAKNHPTEVNDVVKFDAPEGYFKKEEKQYNFYCTLCPFKCMYYKLYCNHLDQTHPGAKNEYEAEHQKNKMSKGSDKLYFCKECDFQTDIALEMENHLPSHTPDQFYVCSLCNFQTQEGNLFKEHQSKEHRSSSTPCESDLVYICPCCAFKTSSLDTYNIHLVAHPLKEKVNIEQKAVKKEPKLPINYQYNCETCGYQAVNAKQLEYHVLAHQSDASYDCDQCKFKTINRQSFRKHVKLVHDVTLPLGRPQKRNDSGDSSSSSSLSRPTTSKAEKYKCNECGFESNSISAYKNHSDAHLAPNSLKCPHCLYRTVRWVNLKSHLSRVHPNEAKTSREDITGGKGDSCLDDSVLYNSPTMFRMNSRPFSSSTPYNIKSTFPSIDAYSSLPVMMPREGTNPHSALGSEEMVVEEIVTEEIVTSEIVTSDHVTAPLVDDEDEEISF